jgi:phosphohistidine phosphatase
MQQADAARTIVIVRHAKAETHAATDHARPLTARGLADARAAGHWLGQRLDAAAGESLVALVSTATRARLTWEQIAAVVPGRTRMLDGLYEAGPDEVLQTLAMLDEAVRVAIVVGHNPTVHEVVETLSDGSTAAHQELRSRGFPTCAVGVLALSGTWRDLRPGACSLTDVHVARG